MLAAGKGLKGSRRIGMSNAKGCGSGLASLGSSCYNRHWCAHPQDCFSEPISRRTQEMMRGLHCSDLTKDNNTDLQVWEKPSQYRWRQLCMDGHNGSLDNFLLVIWLFLNVCPEAPAINPFLEAKQTHRSNGHASQGSLVDRKDIWVQRGEGSVKSELSSEPSVSHTPYSSGREMSQPSLCFCLGSQTRPKKAPRRTALLIGRAVTSFCRRPGRS